jgi:hypothetical protein
VTVAPVKPAPAPPSPEEPAKDEFSRFDQGPLLDQPAFVPDDDADDVDDAVPPPIARHSRSPLSSPKPSEQEAAPPPAPVARAVDPQDRWAQIRKNAAERAAQRQNTRPVAGISGPSKTADADDDTSGEESECYPQQLILTQVNMFHSYRIPCCPHQG